LSQKTLATLEEFQIQLDDFITRWTELEDVSETLKR